MAPVHTPKLRVRVPAEGRAVLTTVEIDGQQWPVYRVSFDSGEDSSGWVRVRLEFNAEIDFESDVPLALTSIEGM